MKAKIELDRQEYLSFLKLLAQAAKYLDKDPNKVLAIATQQRDEESYDSRLIIRPHKNGVILEIDGSPEVFDSIVDGLKKCLLQLPKFRVVQKQVSKILSGMLGNFNF